MLVKTSISQLGTKVLTLTLKDVRAAPRVCGHTQQEIDVATLFLLDNRWRSPIVVSMELVARTWRLLLLVY